MAKFTFKSDYVTTPIKLILPGIIVAAAGYFLFNNPTKKRAEASYDTWTVIKRFEKIFEENADLLPCRADSIDQIRIRKDYIHLLEMTKQNLEDLKETDDLDQRMAAIINLKIDSYNETKTLSEKFVDSVIYLNKLFQTGTYTTADQLARTSRIQADYFDGLNHVFTRDTSMVNQILAELSKSFKRYTGKFETEETVQPVPVIHSSTIGKWMTTDKVLLEINQGGKGTWTQPGFEATTLKWRFDTTMFDKNVPDPRMTKFDIEFANGNHFPLEIIKANKDVLQFIFFDQAGNQIFASACRQTEIKK